MVVTWIERLGIVPERFSKMESGIDRMFAMSRGVEGADALSKYTIGNLIKSFEHISATAN